MSNTRPDKTFAIIGRSLTHSLSPKIHSWLYRRCSLNYTYSAMEVAATDLPAIFEKIRTNEISGINVTYPFKQTVIPLLDELASSTAQVGAVNTVHNTQGKLLGYNTDIFGVLAMLARKLQLNLQNREVLLLGAGGAARACVAALRQQRAGSIWIANRSLEKAERLVADFSNDGSEVSIEALPWTQLLGTSPDLKPVLIINATSAGTDDLKKVLQQVTPKFDQGQYVFWDLNYGNRSLNGDDVPLRLRYVDGLYLLAAQAVESFRIWTGHEVEPESVHEYLLNGMKG